LRISSERGSAPVEFILLGLPMLVVFLICGQITLLSYQNQMLQDAAIEAAMFGALADQNATAAETKAKELLDWEPKVSRAEGLKITYEYFKNLPSDELNKQPKEFKSSN
jgi:hypothetical protein